MKLNEIRKKIDRIDLELLGLIEERMGLALRSIKFKDEIEDTSREKAIFDRARRLGLNLVKPPFAEKLLQTLLEESKRLQSEKRKLVAFQGEHGAYSEVAARQLVESGAYVPCLEFIDVFRGVENGYFDLGVVPVENSLEGAVTQVNDLLTTTELKVIGEVKLPVHHCLLVNEDTAFSEIRVVYSHPQALAQCRGFLKDNQFEARPYYDTAGAARMLVRDRPKAAAVIASTLSAELYGLKIAKTEIEDGASNLTRFLLLSKKALQGAGAKCSIIFAVAHQAGRLYDALHLFADAKINLTRIASMPLRSDPNNYSFFLDFEGSDRDHKVIEVLEQVEQQTIWMKFLGCYPTPSS